MTPAQSRKIRVLVVDDDTEVQEMLREYLSLQGYEVLLAATSIGAMSMARMHRPDVVLLDLMMRVRSLVTRSSARSVVTFPLS